MKKKKDMILEQDREPYSEFIKELNELTTALAQLRSRIWGVFKKISEPCKYRKLIIESNKDYENWNSCTNPQHIYHDCSKVGCSYDRCPLL